MIFPIFPPNSFCVRSVDVGILPAILNAFPSDPCSPAPTLPISLKTPETFPAVFNAPYPNNSPAAPYSIPRKSPPAIPSGPSLRCLYAPITPVVAGIAVASAPVVAICFNLSAAALAASLTPPEKT